MVGRTSAEGVDVCFCGRTARTHIDKASVLGCTWCLILPGRAYLSARTDNLHGHVLCIREVYLNFTADRAPSELKPQAHARPNVQDYEYASYRYSQGWTPHRTMGNSAMQDIIDLTEADPGWEWHISDPMLQVDDDDMFNDTETDMSLFPHGASTVISAPQHPNEYRIARSGTALRLPAPMLHTHTGPPPLGMHCPPQLQAT
ncbi:hypothetical protein J3R83DRAFT_13306 [Lanmaoa asiatica]|nr:hypothetical protein J3R83DRAFT_13306 [Lanmaoa asiatica]